VSIKAFIGLKRTFSVLKRTGYSYNMMTSVKSSRKIWFLSSSPL